MAQSVAGTQQAALNRLRGTEREKDAEKTRERRKNDPNLRVDEVELTEAVRDLKGNTEEEAQDDRQQHAAYKPPSDGHHIDLEG